MALQQPNRPSKLFIPPTPFSATSHPTLPSAVQQAFTPPTLHVQQPSIQASFTNPFHSPITHTPSFRGRHRQNASVAQFSLNSPAPHHPGSFQPALPPFPQSPGPSTFLKSRRTASISLGGPPKALLGGPQRKPSPLAGQQPQEPGKTGDLPATQLPRKKVVVNLPEESGPIIYEDKAYQTPPWTRRPVPYQQSTSQAGPSEPFNIDTREIYPTQEMRQHVKAPFKILLPSQETWITWRKNVLEEKLAQLGVETDDSVPYHEPSENDLFDEAPNSISSPADPALLSFKLNRLQRSQYQEDHIESSISQRDDHSTRMLQPEGVEAPAAVDGPTLGTDGLAAWNSVSIDLHLSNEARGHEISRPVSVRDFARGFGFNAAEDEPVEDLADSSFGVADPSARELVGPLAVDSPLKQNEIEVVAPIPLHSRHASKLSQSMDQISSLAHTDYAPPKNRHSFDFDQRAVETTRLPATRGDDYAHTDCTQSSLGDDEESEGEYSNPSDEERARLKRMHLRMAHLSRGTEELPRPSQIRSHPSSDMPSQLSRTVNRDEDEFSNPSDEEVYHPDVGHLSKASRPLPPIPHSRTTSGSVFLPQGYSHSRVSSNQPTIGPHARQPSSVFARDSLNPFAKPFVFGKSVDHSSLNRTNFVEATQQPFGKPSLNAFAQEFKPSSFSFQPPPGLPHISFPSPTADLPINNSTGREEQGREKRVRRASVSSIPESPILGIYGSDFLRLKTIEQRTLDTYAKSFSPGFTAPKHEMDSENKVPDASPSQKDPAIIVAESRHISPTHVPDPLTFQHHITQNRVPVSLFKSLGPMGSHSKRQSLDDTQVQSISRKASGILRQPNETTPTGTRVVAAPLEEVSAISFENLSPVVQLNGDGQSKLPQGSPTVVSTELFSQVLETVLHQKLADHRDAIVEVIQRAAEVTGPLSKLELLISHFQSILNHNFGVEDGLINSLPQMNQRVARQISEGGQTGSQEHSGNPLGIDLQESVCRLVEDSINRAVVPVTLAATEIAARMDSLENSVATRRAEDSGILVHDLLAVLTPRLDDLRPDPIDFDLLTARLSTAVRPEIHELIDLTSDKKETAVLIMQQLKPMLQGIAANQHELMLNSTLNYMSAELSRLLESFDGHKLKDEISDLVFERLDSRLQLQDQSGRVENSLIRVLEGMNSSIHPLHQSIQLIQSGLAESGAVTMSILPAVESAGMTVVDSLRGSIDKVISSLETCQPRVGEKPDKSDIEEQKQLLRALSSSVAEILNGQASITTRLDHASSDQPDTSTLASEQAIRSLTEITEGVQVDVKALRQHQEIEASDSAKVQLMEARISELLGKVDALQKEKTEILEKARTSETDCNVLDRRLRELESDIATKVEETNDLQAKNQSLSDNLNKTLVRLETTSTSLEKSWERVCELEATNRELLTENASLKPKIEMLELQVKWGSQNAEAREKEIQSLQSDRDRLVAQSVLKGDWQRTTTQLEDLTNILKLRDSKEKEENQSFRDRSKALEGEHTALQKRFREQESKVSNVERAAAAARQNLAQAQQRSADWEKRAQDLESLLERSRQQLDQSEELRRQADSETVTIAAARESEQANYQVTIDDMQREINGLRADLAEVNRNLEDIKRAPVQTWRSHVPNGMPANSPLCSPVVAPNGSRASTPTPGPTKSAIQTPPENDDGLPITSTWNSMHAPKAGKIYSAARVAAGRVRGLATHRPPSPTASVVSNAPTLQEDGWWA